MYTPRPLRPSFPDNFCFTYRASFFLGDFFTGIGYNYRLVVKVIHEVGYCGGVDRMVYINTQF